jgi:glycosyltransferase involved in cell wall biosynthesis
MKVLYILSSYNIYGGTPRKTLWLLEYFKNNSVLYVYSNAKKEFKNIFENSGSKIYEGNFGRNFPKHLKNLLEIIDKEKIDIIHTQFTFGEILAYLIKLFRPNIKVVNSFEGSFPPKNRFKFKLSKHIYKKFNGFVYISNYVKNEKEKQFPILKTKFSKVIYNGVEERKEENSNIVFKHLSLYTTSGLVDWKNIDILIKAFNILINKLNYKDLYLYVAGDGPERKNLEELIKKFNLEKNIYLLGYQTGIGSFLKQCDIYVHPAYAEGFGIAVTEAMIAAKPIIVSNQGALPELIEDKKSGLIADAFNENEWVEAIEFLIKNSDFAKELGINAKKRAIQFFSKEKYVKNYEEFYKELF